MQWGLGRARRALVALLLPSSLFIGVGSAQATGMSIPAGGDYNLTADLVLDTMDTLTAGDDAGAQCRIHGNGFTIRTVADWTGTLTIRNCAVDGLGTASAAAILLTSAGAAAITIERTTFDTSGRIDLQIGGQTSVVFQKNVIAQDSVVSIDATSFDNSDPAFHATFTSDGQKLFQGNTILRSWAKFEKTNNWMIGGDQPGDGNVLIGLRAGIDVEQSDGMTVEGNYAHTYSGFDLKLPKMCNTPSGDCWNQVKNLITEQSTNLLVQHNVFWGRNWTLNTLGQGEIRYNLAIDNVERGWVLSDSASALKIHHNVFIETKRNATYDSDGVFVLNWDTPTDPAVIEIFNNTFVGGATCTPAIKSLVLLNGPDVQLPSLRSNAFADGRVSASSPALIQNGSVPLGAPPDPLLGYADYNLFAVPDSPVQTHYSVAVSGKNLGDPGYGGHDVSVTNRTNIFAQKTPRDFAFDEAMVQAGATTVCQILAYYRQVFTPATAPGSPLVAAADPADGAGRNIGAVGTGDSDPADLFGRAPFCNPTDIGQPKTTADIYTCPAVSVTGPTSSGVVVAGPHGFICVCEVDPGPPSPAGVAILIGIVVGALARRRRGRAR
ncbi:MAG TPA: right-handed parallel beta-helix repeat-containing protein [Polyangia bacterium]